MDPTPNPTESSAPKETETEPERESRSSANQLAQIRSVINSLLEKARGAPLSELASAVEKASVGLRLEAELGKFHAEMSKLGEEVTKLRYENNNAKKRERSERLKEYVSLLTPMVTIVVLAATLVAQNWQFLRSEENKREEALDARWRDAVKTISQTGALSPGVVALQPFLNSQKYREQARDVALQLLSNNANNAFFDGLFGPAFVPLDKNNLGRVLMLDKALLEKGRPVWTKSWVEQTYENDRSRLTPDERDVFDYVEYAVPLIAAQVGSVLKAARESGQNPDLSGAFFKNADWQGANLNGANIENTWFLDISLKDANLANIESFANARPQRTAWWQAQKISPRLLAYWEAAYKFDPSVAYGPKGEKITQQQYESALSRLKSQTQ